MPLRHHFEQNIHVRRRLEQYGAGRCLPYEQAADPDQLAEALIAEQATVPTLPAGGDRRRPGGRRDAGRAGLTARPAQCASPAIRLIVPARMTAPNRYESRECRSAALRMSLLVKSVSETWNVMPMVKAR